MKNKIFLVTDLKIITKLKGLGVEKFAYPLSFFCVGIPKTFLIEEITEDNAYIFVNRVMDTKCADELKKVVHNLPKNIKGIIFDDIGTVEILKGVNIEKILYCTHFNTNYKSINEYFEFVDEVIVSTDITEEEIDEIIKNVNKDISLFVFGLVPSMYSRRTLLTSYSRYHDKEKLSNLEIENNNQKFIVIENEFGTLIYHYPYYNGLRLLNKKAKYYFYYPIMLNEKDILELAKNNIDDIPSDIGFLEQKTIYKVKNN